VLTGSSSEHSQHHQDLPYNVYTTIHLLPVCSYVVLPVQTALPNNHHSSSLTSYLPYKVYTLLITMSSMRMNMNVFYTMVIISFLNRCLNPFIYASQYEEVRRTWTPLIAFLRTHIARIRQLPPPAAAPRIGSVSASVSSHPKRQGMPISSQQVGLDGDKSPHSIRQSTTFIEVKPQYLRKQ